MSRFLLWRLLTTILVVVCVSMVTFAISRVVPGNPARLPVGPHARQAQVDALSARYHLDGPVLDQYGVYMAGLLRGDLGLSVSSRRPVAEDISQYLPALLELTGAAFLLTVVVGLPLGILSAVRRNGPLDYLARAISTAGVSFPVLWLGIVLQVVFSKHLHLLSVGGRLGLLDFEPDRVTGLYTIDALIKGD